MVGPFEWGRDWIPENGDGPGAAPAEVLGDWVSDGMAETDRFFSPDPTSDYELGAASERGACVLSVVDSGAGIQPEHLPHVFDRFYKVDPARANGSGGSGLGLTIAKAIVERHGGALSATSEPGRTVFTVTLPQEAPVEALRAQPASANL